MSLQFEDTIAALASAPGAAARSIIRISGPDVVKRLKDVLSPPGAAEHEWPVDRLPRRYPVEIELAEDCRLPLHLHLWPTNRSYTGQPMAELHVIGSPPLVEEILSRLFASQIRSARPGEFTLRAFLAGRIDLVQAEAVLGIIDANDHEELQLALGQLAGGISNELQLIQVDLIGLLGDLEAGLDFVEEDIEFVSQQQALERIDSMLKRLTDLQEQSIDRMITNVCPKVVLAGLPNAGKSTLFNTLVGDESALVSSIEGTTRDYLSAIVRIAGTELELIDTAGTETSTAGIDSVAQSLGQSQHETADLLIWCTAADLNPKQIAADEAAKESLDVFADRIVSVTTKIDQLNGDAKPATENHVSISAEDGIGLKELSQLIAARLAQPVASCRQMLGSTSARCNESLTAAILSLQAAREATQLRAGDELVAVELRMALDAIGRILGVVYTDDILDHIFSNFCIGK